MALTPEQKAELAGATGAVRSKGPAIDTKTIRWDGKTGELRKVEADGSLIPLEIPLEFVILRKRLAIKGYMNDCSYFTTEYEYTSTLISLFKSENGRVSFVESATAPKLREKYPLLKSVQVLYVLLGGDVCKFEVKGAGFGKFIEMGDKMRENKLESYEVVSMVTKITTDKKGANEYKVMNFDYREMEESEFEASKNALIKVTKEIYEVDKYYAERNAQKAGVDLSENQDLGPLADEFNQVDEDVAKSIPF